MKMTNMNEPMEEYKIRMERIAQRADFSYAKSRETSATGLCFARRCLGGGPYHEEEKLYVSKSADKYVFVEEDIAPMAGHFMWSVLEVPTYEVRNDDEYQYLLKAVETLRFYK